MIFYTKNKHTLLSGAKGIYRAVKINGRFGYDLPENETNLIEHLKSSSDYELDAEAKAKADAEAKAKAKAKADAEAKVK